MTYREIPEIAKLYRSEKWRKLRKQKIALDPVCERCRKEGKYSPVRIVHHKEYVTDKNYWKDEIFFNIDNLESLCFDHHQKEHFGNKDTEEYTFNENGDVVKKGERI